MRKDNSAGTRPYHFNYDFLFKAVAVLLLLTLLSIRFVSGLFAKYTVSDGTSDSARVAGIGEIAMFEHKAVYHSGVYTLDSTSEVTFNQYNTVLPGTEIPKDPYIILTGKNDVSCSLYIEVVNTAIPDAVHYEIDSDHWSMVPDNDALFPTHGGTLYQYKATISPHSNHVIKDIIKENKLFASDTLKDKAHPDNNSNTFSVDFYAYLVQND